MDEEEGGTKASLGRHARPLVKYYVYETRTRLYVVGHTKEQDEWRILKVDRTEARDLVLHEDGAAYSKSECDRTLQEVSAGNQAHGGLQFVTKAFGILGFVKFLEGYYMLLITKRTKLGSIDKHDIYTIAEVEHLPITHRDDVVKCTDPKAESRYLRLLSSLDLTKGFFFSYTYNLECTFQNNRMKKHVSFYKRRQEAFNSMLVWNTFLTEQLRAQVQHPYFWSQPVIHGYFEQNHLSFFGKVVVVTLIARRSRHFAGTRYLKRGVNDFGHVANDVETEQMVDAGGDWDYAPLRLSSFVQVRGSIPLFWFQDSSKLTAKPDIVLRKVDPTYRATRLHFLHLMQRYSYPIIVLNLIKSKESKPRETLLKKEFANAIEYLNQRIRHPSKKIKYIHWDFQKFMHDKSVSILEALADVLSECINTTGFYYSTKACKQDRASPSPDKANKRNSFVQEQMQAGVLRTNCIDCLDRTNVAQFIAGYIALGRQFQVLRLMNTDMLDAESDVSFALMRMYERMGDTLSIQYGGSEAHRAFFKNQRGHWSAATKSSEMLTSLRRFYSNAYTDADKQDAINLFLGYYTPDIDKQPLWELESDYYLHVGPCIVDRGFEASLGEDNGPQIQSCVVRHHFPIRGLVGKYKEKYESFDKILNKGNVQVRLHKDGLKLLPPQVEKGIQEERPSFDGLEQMKKKLIGPLDATHNAPLSPTRVIPSNGQGENPSSPDRGSASGSEEEDTSSDDLERVYEEALHPVKMDPCLTACEDMEALRAYVSLENIADCPTEYEDMLKGSMPHDFLSFDMAVKAQYKELLLPNSV